MAHYRRHNHMLTASDVSRLLNIHINTVRRWANKGLLKTYRIGSRGDRRFWSEDITSFLIEQSNNHHNSIEDRKDLIMKGGGSTWQ
jgi:excisionase family DNA binding protein